MICQPLVSASQLASQFYGSSRGSGPLRLVGCYHKLASFEDKLLASFENEATAPSMYQHLYPVSRNLVTKQPLDAFFKALNTVIAVSFS